ncbi:DUF4817 domain-containing protein [Trichonephila clavipes]|nr:DUF4817 domain-containing protein [Trichonephila clavipes]
MITATECLGLLDIDIVVPIELLIRVLVTLKNHRFTLAGVHWFGLSRQENEMYTKEEYCEMVLWYGQCNRNKIEAARIYIIKFPSRRHLSYCTIARAVQHLYKTGSCHRRIPLSCATPSQLGIPAEDVLGYAVAHHENRVRDISKACSYSKSAVWNILQTYVAYP